MTNKYVGAANFIKNLITGNKVSKTIDSVKPGTKFKGTPKYQTDIIKARSNVMKKFQPVNEGIAKQTTELRKTLQKIRGEKVTPSGVSKGKDVGPGIYEPKKKTENKAKGGRIGYKKGTNPFKRKTNIDKIKKTFGPKSLGMQSVIYGLDKNKNITKADPKAKFIAAAKNKKKKVIG